MKLFKVTTDDRSNKWINLELISEANLAWLPGGKPVRKTHFLNRTQSDCVRRHGNSRHS